MARSEQRPDERMGHKMKKVKKQTEPKKLPAHTFDCLDEDNEPQGDAMCERCAIDNNDGWDVTAGWRPWQ